MLRLVLVLVVLILSPDSQYSETVYRKPVTL